LHLCRREDLVTWLGPTIWRVEIAPEAHRLVCEDKIVVSQARIVAPVTTWTDRAARLFGADCAERALLAERAIGREPDVRTWAAIQAARDYAEGRISDAARSAAESAAESAARSAAWSAAESGERTWQTDRLFTAYLLMGAP